MDIHFYLAPAGHGKTAYVLARLRQVRAAEPLAPVAVILPNQAQVTAFRQRLSAGGGALAVNLSTFNALYADLLAWAGQPAPRLPAPVQYRLIRSLVARLVDAGQLPYYAPLRDKPGFVVLLRSLLEELKRARLHRDQFRAAVAQVALTEARLTELAEIYAAYQDWLSTHGWADTEGQGWLAARALERQPALGRELRLLIVDGFDEFNPTQLAVLNLLAGRAAETIITLTGDLPTLESEGEYRSSNLTMDTPPLLPLKSGGEGDRMTSRPAWRRFYRARRALTDVLKLAPEPLPQPALTPFAPALAHLEAYLFNPQAPAFPLLAGQEPAITFIEAQNRAEEVRAALRWLKSRLVRDGLAPAEAALLARDLTPYRPFIEETAAEFGLTLHLREPLRLAANPAIAALMSLLALPLGPGHTPGNWACRPLLDAWRSPYFDHLAPGQTDRLERVARQGVVIHGLDQWRVALAQQVEQAARRGETSPAFAPPADEELQPPDQLSLAEAHVLLEAFESFVARISPPPQATLRQYAGFVEALIGADPKLTGPDDEPADPEVGPSLGLVKRARVETTTAQRDIAALRTFKDVLRGLVLAEASLPLDTPVAYDQFYTELQGAVQGAAYYLPPPKPLAAALPVLTVLNARGLSFAAVALIGLAEGEFPPPEQEDILLREEDRQALRQAGLTGLESRLRGEEISLFYQAVTRAREQLLLCRPYLADDGQSWEASPYWSAVQQLVAGPVIHLRPEDPLPLSQVASPQELARSDWAAAQPALPEGEWAGLGLPAAALSRLRRSAAILQARLAAEPQGEFEGDLTHLAARFSAEYGPGHVWSASRLEAYGLCPHHFWLSQALALTPRQPPEEGFDVFILGSMYHEILEQVYRQAGDQTGLDHLLALLPAIAQKVFDQAPAVYGFRPTALWGRQRPELEQILANTLTALAKATADSAPLAQEQRFGLDDQPPLLAQANGDEFRLRGFIDRVDRTHAGGLRIIDYKSGATPIAARDLVEGRRLQIALYALAARDALALGEIADGFYWHIGSAKASSLKLDKFPGGVAAALQTALAHAFRHIAGVRAGRFPPTPPPAGCPGHCPGVNFCWRYQPKGW